jgi:hypothetical protein
MEKDGSKAPGLDQRLYNWMSTAVDEAQAWRDLHFSDQFKSSALRHLASRVQGTARRRRRHQRR